MTGPDDPLVLDATWRSLVTGFLAPLILIAIAAISVAVTDGFALGALVLALIGLVMLLIALWDMPRSTEVDETGIHRRCVLRRHHLPWERVTALVRAPGPFAGGTRADGAGRARRALGGLTALVGRRRYLLVDQIESADEYAHLRAVVAAHGPGVALRAAEPPRDAPPTWMYHRKRE